MALSTPRIIGRDVTVSCTAGSLTTLTKWQTVSVQFNQEKDVVTAADATKTEKVFITDEIVLTFKGYLGSVNNGSTLPALRDTMTNFNVAVGADSVLPSLAAYTNIKVSDANYDFDKSASTWGFKAESGMLN